MTQTLHIFRKDVRRFRFELCAVGALTGGFAWSHAAADMPGPPEFSRAVMLAYLTVPFLAVAWWFLVSQLIHEESLAGNRQFWITRPYSWRHLLAAKLLFVVVFVNVPLLAAQIAILAAAGYQPLAGLPRLLWMQLAVTMVLITPAIALATVTRNLAQFVMSILCAVLAVYMALAALRGSGSGIDISGPWLNRAVAVLIACAGAALIFRWQYSRRLTDASIIAGLCTLLLAGAFYIGLPMQAQYALRSSILRSPETSAVSVSIAPGAEIDRSNQQNPSNIVLLLPITIAGLPGGDAARPEIITVSFENPAGLHWSSGWMSASRWYPISTADGPKMRYQQILALPRDLYRRVGDQTVTLHGSMYLSLERQAAVSLLPASATRIPGGGFCEVTDADNEKMYDIFCSAPFRQPYNSSTGGGVDIDRGAAGIERHERLQLLALWESPWPDVALSPVFIERFRYESKSGVAFVKEDPRACIRHDFAAHVHMPAAPRG
jgi:hypothetical protein